MSLRRIRPAAAILALALCAATAGAEEAAFVDNLERHDKTLWRKSDGWANGWSKIDTGWVGRHIALADGRMTITLDDSGASGRRYASGEYQSRRFFGYGRFEARLKAVAAPGIVTGFFTYTGPTFDGAPHDEIDFEFLGRSPRQVQLNYYTAGKGGHETMIDLGFDASEDFHTYAFEWRPDSIRWFVDGRQVHEETGARGPLPSHPGKIFLHVWAGKNLDGWLGRVSYPGHPLVAEFDCVAFVPLDSDEPGCGS
ncbi:MAG: glycoside hydrolase family 16 protein [Bacteroidota bacterium]|nr:glycoside hydrolase family 16 protein [Kiloniellaceae bacterium]